MRNWILGLIGVSAVVLLGLYAGLSSLHMGWLQVIFLSFTLYGTVVLFAAAVIRPRKFLRDESYQPFVSFIVPARNEEKVIAATIRSLMRVDYLKEGRPNFEVIVMDDNSGDGTLEEASALMADFPNLKVVHRGPDVAGKGKSDVLNHGVRVASGELIGVFDADTNAAPDFLKKSIPLLADPKVGGVQGRVRLYNRDKNILTSLQDDEFAALSHLFQIGKEQLGGLTALGGNGQFVKREALESCGGWNYLSPTEDLDLTFRFIIKGWYVRYAPDAVLWQEGVETPAAFVRQRVRWSEGFLKCMFDYIVPLLGGRMPLMIKIDGVMTMLRIVVPFYAWLGYIFMLSSMAGGLEFNPGMPPWVMGLASWTFFVVTAVGMNKVLYPGIITAAYRVALYFMYSGFWIIALPLGFANCIRHINDIYWDKTEHLGAPSAVPEVKTSLKAKYRETEAVS
jgi:1,2-diacylglycerol 3-beta-glucosyltransferase